MRPDPICNRELLLDILEEYKEGDVTLVFLAEKYNIPPSSLSTNLNKLPEYKKYKRNRQPRRSVTGRNIALFREYIQEVISLEELGRRHGITKQAVSLQLKKVPGYAEIALKRQKIGMNQEM